MVFGGYVGFGGSISIVLSRLVVEGYMGLGGSPWWQYRARRNQVGSFDSPQQWVLRLKGIKVKDKVRYILLHLLPNMTFSLNTFES